MRGSPLKYTTLLITDRDGELTAAVQPVPIAASLSPGGLSTKGWDFPMESSSGVRRLPGTGHLTYGSDGHNEAEYCQSV